MSAPAAPLASPRRPLVVALTGGIASGKSLVASLFAAHGVAVVDTDAIAHQLTAPGGEAIADLCAAFGPDMLDADGAMDRAAMRARVFADPAARHTLERLLHGRIRTISQAALLAAKSPYALLAIPLFAEAGPDRPAVDRVLVVDCPEPLQRARALTRPGLTAAQLDAILAVQASREQRLAIADEVIDNSASVESLQARVRQLDDFYRQLARERSA